MTHLPMALQRLHNQKLIQPALTNPVDVVKWFGAVQAQDFAGAKWTLGQRMLHATDDALEQAFNNGSILRTHVMRPTWHFVAPDDLRWLLTLTAPRVKATVASYYRQLELDNAILTQSNTLLINALKGGNYLTKPEILTIFKQAGISTDAFRLGFLLMHAELEMIICSGPRRGKQFTYALFDERVPATTIQRDTALAELTRRYFTSHGPATLQGYMWWSGLAAADAREGLDMVKSQLHSEVFHDKTYWFPSTNIPENSEARSAHLLPTYDEYTITSKDHPVILDQLYTRHIENGVFVFDSTIIVDGLIAGTWKRTLKQHDVIIEISLLRTLNESETQAVSTAIDRYANFIGKRIGNITGLSSSDLVIMA